MEASPTRVLRSEELAAGGVGEPRIHRVDVAGTPVLVARLAAGELVAFSATCPHQQTNLDAASFCPDGNLRCPTHEYLYDPRTGENLEPARQARPENLWKLKPGYLPVYPVAERDGWIWVTPRSKPPPASYDPAREVRPVAGGLLAPALAAPPATMVPGGAEDRPGTTLQVREGSTFELRLETTPRPGFLWRVHLDGPLLAVVEERYDPSEASHKVKVAARAPGQTALRCTYARPWDSVPAEVRTYSVQIEPA